MVNALVIGVHGLTLVPHTIAMVGRLPQAQWTKVFHLHKVDHVAKTNQVSATSMTYGEAVTRSMLEARARIGLPQRLSLAREPVLRKSTVSLAAEFLNLGT